MPRYEWECSSCGRREDKIFGMREYDAETLAGVDCVGVGGGDPKCPGTFETTFDSPPAIGFRGSGWTPHFGLGGDSGRSKAKVK